MSAEDVKGASRVLAEQGIYVEKVEAMRPGSGLSPRRRSALYRSLSALLKAGLPLDRALGLLLEEGMDPAMAETLAPVRDAVCEGRPFAAAMADAEPRLAGHERAMLEAAERTGALASILQSMADAAERRVAMADRIRSAAAYPCFVLGLGILVAFFLLGVMVPMAQRSLVSAGIGLPPLSLAIVTSARVAALSAAVLLVGGTLAAALVAARCRTSQSARERVGRNLLRIPLLGRGLKALAACRFASTLASLLRAGVPLVDGFGLAGEATGNAWLAHASVQQAAAIRDGSRVSEGIAAIPELAPSLREWVRVGEVGGCLDAMLDVAAERAQTLWDRTCERFLALLGPVVLVCVGAFVLAVALAVLLPVTMMTLQVAG